MASYELNPSTTTGVTHSMSTTGVGDTLTTTGINTTANHTHPSNNRGRPLTEVIDEQSARIEELEKLVQLLIAEVLPERAI